MSELTRMVLKYVCYVRLQDVPAKFEDWMRTNPRDQKHNKCRKRNCKSIDSQMQEFPEKNRYCNVCRQVCL